MLKRRKELKPKKSIAETPLRDMQGTARDKLAMFVILQQQSWTRAAWLKLSGTAHRILKSCSLLATALSRTEYRSFVSSSVNVIARCSIIFRSALGRTSAGGAHQELTNVHHIDVMPMAA